MENATDALKMAFAVFAFIAALSIALNSFSHARETADATLWASDKTNFYDWTESKSQEEGREVGKDAIIATLFRKQSDTYIIVDLKSKNTKYVFTPYNHVTEINKTTNSEYDINMNATGKTDDGREIVKMNYKIYFINEILKDEKTYYENVSEVTNRGELGGEYMTADDGTKLQVIQGVNKVIITYTEK